MYVIYEFTITFKNYYTFITLTKQFNKLEATVILAINIIIHNCSVIYKEGTQKLLRTAIRINELPIGK